MSTTPTTCTFLQMPLRGSWMSYVVAIAIIDVESRHFTKRRAPG